MSLQTQSPNAIFMVRPSHFGYNVQTADSNVFQDKRFKDRTDIARKAQLEFDGLLQKIQLSGVKTFVFEENDARTPDAIFPNNWISFHPSGEVVLYPMMAENRRLEKRNDILAKIEKEFLVEEIFDIGFYEKEQKFLEGTGSIIFDYQHRIAYANRSPRTHDDLFYLICHELGYEPVLFDACDRHMREIYHTNVLMALADHFCVICLEAIMGKNRDEVKGKLMDTGHSIVDISYSQLESFVGNMIQLSNQKGEDFMIMSETALQSLDKVQLKIIEQHCGIIYSDLSTIEAIGGGSARCMIAGIFLQEKK